MMLSQLKDMRIKEMILSYQYPLKDLVNRCPKKVLEKIWQCVMCETETGPLIYGTCIRGNVICRACMTACVEELNVTKEQVICSYEYEDNYLCGEIYLPLDLDNGMPPHIDYYLSKCTFTCVSSLYGCQFEGSGLEILRHEKNGCAFSGFQKCEQKLGGKIPGKCAARFHSGVDFLKHQVKKHGFTNTYQPLHRITVVLKDENLHAEPDRIYHKLLQYKVDRYCYVHVVEYKYWIRVWASEADSSVDLTALVPTFKITAPALDDPNITTNYKFTGKLLPFNTIVPAKNPVEYCDISKDFLRQFYCKTEDGHFEVSIYCEIGDPLVPMQNVLPAAAAVSQQNEDTGYGNDGDGAERDNEKAGDVKEEDGENKEEDDEIIARPFMDDFGED